MTEKQGEYEVSEVQTTGVHSDIGRFAIVPEWLLDTEVSPRAIRLFAVLAAKYADRETATGFPRRRVLAGAVGLSMYTLDKCIAELIDIGALSKEARHSPDGDQISNLYHLRYSRPAVLPVPQGENLPLPTQRKSDTYPESVNHNQVTRDAPEDDSETAVSPSSSAPKGANDDSQLWPEWYSLLYGIPGFKEPFPQVEAWRVANNIRTDLAEVKAYAVRDWWPRQPKSRTKNGSVYMTWQNWCRRDRDQETPTRANGSPPAAVGFNREGRGRPKLLTNEDWMKRESF